MAKRRVSVYLDEDLVRRAREFGLNLSAFFNARLREFLEGGAVPTSEGARREEESGKEVRRPGFEPGSSAWGADVLPG